MIDQEKYVDKVTLNNLDEFLESISVLKKALSNY